MFELKENYVNIFCKNFRYIKKNFKTVSRLNNSSDRCKKKKYKKRN